MKPLHDDVGPIWLDVTRLVSRIGLGPMTGIDRVELAYLVHLTTLGDPDTRFVTRTTRGFLLLDHVGGRILADLARGEREPGRADAMSRLAGRGARPRHRVEATLRSVAVGRCTKWGLHGLLTRSKGPVTYINTGHSNLSDRVLAAFSSRPLTQVAVLVHDLIPLTHPQFVVPDQPAIFAGRIDRVRRHADLVICNSAATKAGLVAHWGGNGPHPALAVAHLGVDLLPKADAERDRGHIVMLGTIEPRKNHALMLDVWEALAREIPATDLPQLHIIGRPGWRMDDIMARVRTHPLLGHALHYHGPLPDAEVASHLARAGALVFPSLAEGYGYPPLEAAHAGALPICSDLPVFRETLGDCAVYVKNADLYSWLETIKKYVVGNVEAPDLARFNVPSWADHFSQVGKALTHDQGEGP
ncbi:MAG: glycosyltransferase [Roseicyclus sp.]